MVDVGYHSTEALAQVGRFLVAKALGEEPDIHTGRVINTQSSLCLVFYYP